MGDMANSLNFPLVAAGTVLLFLSTWVEEKHNLLSKRDSFFSKFLSIPGLLMVVSGFNWHVVRGFVSPH